MRNYFESRKIIIATKHQKEQVIAPLLSHELGLSCFVPDNFDTDRFGTFSGEVKRTHDALETARLKCLAACEQFQTDLAIASEGSFGMHPDLFFLSADTEILYLLDLKNSCSWHTIEISTKTNFSGAYVESQEELMMFAQAAQFPTHALILKPSQEATENLIKGIKSEKDLITAFNQLKSKHKKVFVETDMRAMHNPTRMSVIGKATLKLIDKLKSLCPVCKSPGYSVNIVKSGLPCADCGEPTEAALWHVYTCSYCQFADTKKYPHGKMYQDPMYCQKCNP